MVITYKWVIMRNEGFEKDEVNAKQVYGDKFMDYDYACQLTSWLNKHAQGGYYWMKEVEEGDEQNKKSNR